MAKDIPITTGRGVQAVALVFAAVLAGSAYLFATTGWGTPTPGCWPTLPRPVAIAVAVLQLVLAAGFVVAALRDRSGPSVDDPLLIALVLALFALLATAGGVHALVTDVARFGKSGCLEIGSPWSYGAGILSIGVGALAAYVAATVALGRGNSS